MAAKRKARKAKPKRSTKITRTRPIRPHAVFVRLFKHERETLRAAAGKVPLARFIRDAALAFAAGETPVLRKQ